jgi:hypothetical protein
MLWTTAKPSSTGRYFLEVDRADTEAIRKSEEEIAELQLSITRSEAQIQILVDALVSLSAPAAASQ